MGLVLSSFAWGRIYGLPFGLNTTLLALSVEIRHVEFFVKVRRTSDGSCLVESFVNTLLILLGRVVEDVKVESSTCRTSEK